MSRPGTGGQALVDTASVPVNRRDTCIHAAAGAAVVGLAGIAGVQAFHCVTLAHVDPAFAKYQLILLCRKWFRHPSGPCPPTSGTSVT
jgi:hypothetical protein